ncbi:MAG: acyl carrier protein [Salinisphaera sp.]|nr:acyl carrier protein [Salinisphaera sp.]MDN5938823.1 acyl carrier protein [Salinisphaera sp.]
MITYQDIQTHLLALLREQLGSEREITAASLLVDDLGLDSVVAMELLMDMEDRLDIAIPVNILPDVYSVDDLVRAIDRLMGSRPA